VQGSAKSRPKSGILECKGLLHLFISFGLFPIISSGYGGKKKAGGHFEKWNVVFCFSKCLPKSYAK
jgi:hypothetical protein